jgi:hypothetical protein
MYMVGKSSLAPSLSLSPQLLHARVAHEISIDGVLTYMIEKLSLPPVALYVTHKTRPYAVVI